MAATGGKWTQLQTIESSTANDNFGVGANPQHPTSFYGRKPNAIKISSDGSIIFVGASTVGTNVGRVYIYNKGVDNLYSLGQTLGPFVAGDYFGYALDLYNDTYLAVGAIGNDTGFADAGAVYLFTSSGGTWSRHQTLTSSNAAASNWLGGYIKFNQSSGRLFISAYSAAGGGYTYVFTGSGVAPNLRYHQHQKLSASGGATGGAFPEFGYSINTDDVNNYVIISSPSRDSTGDAQLGANKFGATYIFTASLDNFYHVHQKITSSAAIGGPLISRYGQDVMISGSYIFCSDVLDYSATDGYGYDRIEVLTQSGGATTKYHHHQTITQDSYSVPGNSVATASLFGWFLCQDTQRNKIITGIPSANGRTSTEWVHGGFGVRKYNNLLNQWVNDDSVNLKTIGCNQITPSLILPNPMNTDAAACGGCSNCQHIHLAGCTMDYNASQGLLILGGGYCAPSSGNFLTWAATEYNRIIIFKYEDIYEPTPCSLQVISSNFTLNNYNCLSSQHIDTFTDGVNVVPFSFGSRSVNLRLRSTPLSCSVGQQSSIGDSFDYSKFQRKKDEELEEQNQSGSL